MIQYDDNLVGLEIALRIVLLIFMLLFALKANESAASSSCDGDVNTCTPKQICETATIPFDNRLVWSVERSKEKFVNLAKELGMTCAIDPNLSACLSDPALCSVADLCLLATDNLGEKLNWVTDQKRSMHVELAKGFGLNCSEKITNKSHKIFEPTINNQPVSKGSHTISASKNNDTIAPKKQNSLYLITIGKVWLNIENLNGDRVFQGYLTKGEKLYLPNDSEQFLISGGRPGWVYFELNEKIYGPVGHGTDRFRNLRVVLKSEPKTFNKVASRLGTTNQQTSGFSMDKVIFRLQRLPNADLDGVLRQDGMIRPMVRPTPKKEDLDGVLRPKARPTVQISTLTEQANSRCITDPLTCTNAELCKIKNNITAGSAKIQPYLDILKKRNVTCADTAKNSALLTTQKATIKRALNVSEVNLLGVYYFSGKRSALVRLKNGKRMLVKEGDSLDGGKISQINPRELHYIKNGKEVRLVMFGKWSSKKIEVDSCYMLKQATGALTGAEKSSDGETFGDIANAVDFYEEISNTNNEKCDLSVKSNSEPKPKASHFSDLKRPKEDINKLQNISSGIDQQSITKKIQLELNRIGCNVGPVDGQIGPNTRRGLYKFSQQSGIKYREADLSDENFLRFLQSQMGLVCKQTVYLPENFEDTNSAKQSTNDSAELMRLKDERDALYANLRATEDLIAAQKRAAEAPYRACLSNCMLNNRAGKGVIAGLNGIAQCNSSCAPLKWGGEVIPPSWERDKLRLRTVECMITRISRNQATASCR